MLRIILCSTFAFVAMTSTALAQTEPARPPNRCQIAGRHVSGMVSVDFQNGSRGEVPLVDVEATIAMARRSEDIVVSVTSPLTFSGTFVAGDRGGPGAYAPRQYRAVDRGVTLKPNVPVEIRLAASDDHATLRAPVVFGQGALEVDVPCSALAAGAPRVDFAAPRPDVRGEFVSVAGGTIVRATASESGAEVARVVTTNSPARVTVKGRMASPAGGFVRVSLSVGPITVDGFVPASAVEAAGRNLTPGATVVSTFGSTATSQTSEYEATTVTLPAATQVFADYAATRPWATVTAAMQVTLRRRVGFDGRFALDFGEASVVQRRCRLDGVAGYSSCGEARTLPRMSVLSCGGEGCTHRGYVDPP